MWNKRRTGCAWAMLLLLNAAAAGEVTITFDTDAAANPLVASDGFINSERFTEQFSALGVHSRGPQNLSGGYNGGAILTQVSNFGVNAHSGRNFLAFNRDFQYRDPQTITFDAPVTLVSIYAAGGTNADTFSMQAFDAGGALVGTDSVTTQGWSQLSVASPAGTISRVVLTETGDATFVFDDLSFTPVPEPTGGVAAIGVAAWAARRRRTGTRRLRDGSK